MQSFMCLLICPRLCISVGSYTPKFPGLTLAISYTIQPNMGKFKSTSNQCPCNSSKHDKNPCAIAFTGTHWFNFEQHCCAFRQSHSKSESVITCWLLRKKQFCGLELPFMVHRRIQNISAEITRLLRRLRLWRIIAALGETSLN